MKAFYSTLLNICNQEKAVCEGKFFDLMYVNPQSSDFNPHRQYAFMRSDEHDAILVVTNFNDQPLYTAVNIPQHAFDYMELKERDGVTVKELLSGQTFKANINPNTLIRITVPAQSGVILKWKK